MKKEDRIFYTFFTVLILSLIIIPSIIFYPRKALYEIKPKTKVNQTEVTSTKGSTIESTSTYLLARITHYTEHESCTYRTVKGCLVASGGVATPGRTAACPRSIRLGVRVRIFGNVYVCDDRYATWVDKKFPLPTFDIFTTSTYEEARAFGARTTKVEILN